MPMLETTPVSAPVTRRFCQVRLPSLPGIVSAELTAQRSFGASSRKRLESRLQVTEVKLAWPGVAVASKVTSHYFFK